MERVLLVQAAPGTSAGSSDKFDGKMEREGVVVCSRRGNFFIRDSAEEVRLASLVADPEIDQEVLFWYQFRKHFVGDF